MAESTLSIQIADLANEVGYYLGFGRTPSNWSGWQSAAPYVPSTADSQLGDFLSVLKHAQRMVYQPPPASPQDPPHRWSFLTPEATITTAASQSDYPLPDDYGGFEGWMTYQPAANYGITVKRVGVGKVRAMNQLSAGLVMAPQYFAEVPLKCDGATGQRFAVAFYPTPDQAYVLTYRYNVQTNALTSAQPFPYGGAQHAELFLAAALAAAELHLNDQPGPHYADFQQRLAAAIAVDARAHRPEYLGYVGDRSDGSGWYGPGFWGDHAWNNYVTYNGASLGA